MASKSDHVHGKVLPHQRAAIEALMAEGYEMSWVIRLALEALLQKMDGADIQTAALEILESPSEGLRRAQEEYREAMRNHNTAHRIMPLGTFSP